MKNDSQASFLQPKKNRKAPNPGDVVKVHQIIKEKGKERIQIFEGLVISVKKPNSPECSFTVRKESEGIGVERIFPLYSPIIKRIETVSTIHRRQSKLYYIREKAKKLRGTEKEQKEEEQAITEEEKTEKTKKEAKPKVKESEPKQEEKPKQEEPEKKSKEETKNK